MSLSAAQIAERHEYIGASEAPILAGVSPYRTSEHELWLSKVGLGPAPDPEAEAENDNDAQSVGHELEPIALRMLGSRLGRQVFPVRTTRRHAIIPFVAATPDGLIGLQGTPPEGCEAKAPGAHYWHHWGRSGDPEGIPSYVMVQCEIQCTVWRFPRVHVGALLGTEFRSYVYERREELGLSLLDLISSWWERHVVARVPPAPDGSAGADRMLRKLFPRHRPESALRAGDEGERLAKAYFDARREREAAEKREEAAKQAMQLLLGENAVLIGDGWRAAWLTDSRGAPDWKAIAEEGHPSAETIEAHRRPPSRKFTCKATKAGRTGT